MRNIRATVGNNFTINCQASGGTVIFSAITYADVNKWFNGNSILQNLKIRWFSVHILTQDSTTGGTLRVEVANCFLQDRLDSTNVYTWDDQGTVDKPPRIMVKIPPTQQVSLKGSSTDNFIYFAYILPVSSTTLGVSACVRVGLTGRL